MNRWYPLSQMILSRLREFYREPEAVFWVYGFPVLLAIVLGLAFAGGAPEPPTVDVQQVGDQAAEDKVAQPLVKAGHKVEVLPAAACEMRLRTGRSALTVVPGKEGLTYIYDPNRSDCVLARRWVDDVLARDSAPSGAPTVVDAPETRPGNRYIDFLLPGLIGMNLVGGGLFGIGFVIVEMRVRKLFKRLLATPMDRHDFLLSLLIARLAFLIPEMTMLFVLGYLWGVPIYGNPLALVVIILVGVATFDALGLLVACRTEKMETVSGLVNLVMLPMYLLSGTFFSSKRFPDWAQPFIQALPLTQVNDALREVMLEGAGLVEVAWRLGILLLYTVVCSALALRWFRWR
jgi:ABC transporter DrrB family efflux protein